MREFCVMSFNRLNLSKPTSNKTKFLLLIFVVVLLVILNLLFNHFLNKHFQQIKPITKKKVTAQQMTLPEATHNTRNLINLRESSEGRISNGSRCQEIRRRVSWGVVEYAAWDGDPELQELLQPIFTKKRLVIWALDCHPGPTDDVRSIIEPLGVEFIQHIIPEQKRCHLMCVCDRSPNAPNISITELYRPSSKVFDRLYSDSNLAPDMARADAFMTGSSVHFIELYMKFNRSIIAISTIRYHLGITFLLWTKTDSEGFHYAIDFDPVRLSKLNDQFRELMKNKIHIIGANSLYDLEFMHYFVGIRPEYIPGFAGYTGEHYNPINNSFLYARHPYGVKKFWNEELNRCYKLINATFRIHQIKEIYKSGIEFSDIVKHMGIVHQPYQVWHTGRY